MPDEPRSAVDPPLERMRQLDGLRAVAVGMVLYAHYLGAWTLGLPLGRGGVLLFFVLSGFLITGILLRCRDYVVQGRQPAGSTLRQFYARRFLRIFPLFYAALLVTAVVDIPPVRRTLLWHVFYLSNVYVAKRGDWITTVSHFWSLAVEEQFYLVWPCCVLFLSPRVLGRIVVGVIVAAPALRAAGIALGMPVLSVRVLTPGCMDLLGFGALLALLATPDARPRPLAVLLSPVAGVTALALATAAVAGASEPETRAIWLDSALGVLAFWVVGRAATGFRGLAGRVLASAPAIALGRISYGIYILHPLTPKLLGKLGFALEAGGPAAHALPTAAILTVTTIALAALSWRYYEAPLNALKRRYPYRLVSHPIPTIPLGRFDLARAPDAEGRSS
ncbi:MAG: acyltransferase [Candidatus Binatia bacterium]